MAYGARLESGLGASPQGFESPILRHSDQGVRRSGPARARPAFPVSSPLSPCARSRGSGCSPPYPHPDPARWREPRRTAVPAELWPMPPVIRPSELSPWATTRPVRRDRPQPRRITLAGLWPMPTAMGPLQLSPWATTEPARRHRPQRRRPTSPPRNAGRRHVGPDCGRCRPPYGPSSCRHRPQSGRPVGIGHNAKG